MHKISGKTLCRLHRTFHLTKCLACDIMENSAQEERLRRDIIPHCYVFVKKKNKKIAVSAQKSAMISHSTLTLFNY